MAETGDNPTDSHHTVHDVFRFLVDVRGLAPFVAKKEILEKLQLDRLHVDLHIRGGARKMRPSRQATIDELRAQAAGGTLDHLYETTPPEGVTFPVHPDCWGAGKIFDLMISDGKLIVIQQHSLDLRRDAYSFTG